MGYSVKNYNEIEDINQQYIINLITYNKGSYEILNQTFATPALNLPFGKR